MCNNCINNDECLSKSSKNKVVQQHGHADKRRVEKHVDHRLFNTFFCKESSIIIHLMLYIF